METNMGMEIERKFLVHDAPFETWGRGVKIEQGYLARGQEATARVRTFGTKGFLTIKGKTIGISRQEFEYEIPLKEAQALLKLCEGGIIIKRRWHVKFESHTWEIDRFEGNNAGLIIAEIELETENELFIKPNWLGAEVSDDPRYFNGALSRHPYQTWSI